MKGVSFQQPLARKEQGLVKAQKLSVPVAMIEPFIEFLAKQRDEGQKELEQSKEEELMAEMVLEEARNKRRSIEQRQEMYDKNYQLAVNFKTNPDAEEFTFYQPSKSVTGEKSSPIVGAPTNVVQPNDKSNNATPKGKTIVNWMKLAETCLERRGHFMDINELVADIYHQFPETKAKAIAVYKNEATALALVSISFKGHAARVGNRKSGEQILIMYENKFGLYKWVNKDLIPISPYGKQFGIKYDSEGKILSLKAA
jgi:hypothetical protein